MDLTELIDKRADKRIEIKQIPTRKPATILSFTEGWLRADVRLTNGTVVSGMVNKSGERLKEGQSVYIEYMTLPSDGWIAMTTGEADPLSQGGGGEGTKIHIENAAVITPKQAGQLVGEEKIMYVDEATPATVIYGQPGNWFYINGYPVWFSDNEEEKYDERIKNFEEDFFPTTFEVVTSDRMGGYPMTKYIFTLNLLSIQVVKYEKVAPTYISYTLQASRESYGSYTGEDEEWNYLGSNTYNRISYHKEIYDSNDNPLNENVELYKIGFLIQTDLINKNLNSINAHPVAITIDNNSKTITPHVIVGGNLHIDNIYFKNEAEEMFAFGMTKTSEPEELS